MTGGRDCAAGPHPIPAETPDQCRELLVHRSVYYLKEADLHTRGFPVAGTHHPQLFRALLTEWGLSTRYGRYLDCVPGISLLTSNLISLFGLRRRIRGALPGDFQARCAAYAAEQLTVWVLPRWAVGQSSLLQGFTD